MAWRSTVRDAAHRAYLGLTRGTLKKPSDNHKWQTCDIDLHYGVSIKDVERAQQYGFTSVPNKQKDDKDEHPAECVVGFLGGNNAHPIILSIDDRRSRLYNMKEGDVALYDSRGQRVVIKEGAISVESPKSITNRVIKEEDDKQQQGGQSGQSGGGQSGGGQQSGEQAGSKQDAQKERKDRTRVTQGEDHFMFEVLDGEGKNVKTSFRMDQNGITHKADNITSNAKEAMTLTADQSYKVQSPTITAEGNSQGWKY